MIEEGSELASELWEVPRAVASSILSYPEGRAALAAARRGERLTGRGYESAVASFEATQSEIILIGIDRPLARRGGLLAAEHGLRGYDAVHLASALALGPDTTTVVTWDKGLSRAARRSGCAVAPAT